MYNFLSCPVEVTGDPLLGKGLKGGQCLPTRGGTRCWQGDKEEGSGGQVELEPRVTLAMRGQQSGASHLAGR